MFFKKEFIGGFIGFVVFLIPLTFIFLSIFSTGLPQVIGMTFTFLCFIFLISRKKEFKEIGVELTRLKFWIKK